MRSFFLIGFLVVSLQVAEAGGLSQSDVERVKACRKVLQEVDHRPLAKIIDELEKTQNSQANLLILEAMAKAYTEIVAEQHVNDRARKEWLYSMVKLNMAYLQFGGIRESGGKGDPLNKLIRKKLKAHLPQDLFEQKSVFFSLEDE